MHDPLVGHIGIGEGGDIDRLPGDQLGQLGLVNDRDTVRIERPREHAGYARPAISGICVAVNAATTRNAGLSRYSTLKSWKSRPAAPRMTTFWDWSWDPLQTAAVDRRDRHTLPWVVLAAGPAW